ncbi:MULTISPECIES: alpha/beta fold hydrolase [unclassified Kribbella]|uniref:alpha/beta fold hydrolase n=1 Tax=unclassified Kribbella TaxID=2644121 RepID=UPI00301897CC
MAATKFEVGTYKLAAEISGEGSPAVVFSAGSGDAGEPWAAVMSGLRSSTTLVTYARAGIGESETPADRTPRSVGAAAEELHRLLVAADIARPFVLVGHSLGALVALIFTAQRPQDLAGLVLVDATDIHLNLDIENPRTVAADGDRADHMSFDVLASAEEVARSRRPPRHPNRCHRQPCEALARPGRPRPLAPLHPGATRRTLAKPPPLPRLRPRRHP